MKNKFLQLFVLLASVIALVMACSKNTDSNTILQLPTDYSFTEEFDTISKTIANGWVIANNSKPIGTMTWMQGNFYVSLYHGKLLGPVNYPYIGGFGAGNPSFSGSDFIMSTVDCGAGNAIVSNWLISPETMMKDGDEINFYTRTYSNPAVAADRLELRVDTADSKASVGIDSNSVGGFSKILLQVNPDLLLKGDGAYPGSWTKFTVKIAGVPVPKKTRVAFRYFISNSGPLGDNGLGVGIDKFTFTSR